MFRIVMILCFCFAAISPSRADFVCYDHGQNDQIAIDTKGPERETFETAPYMVSLSDGRRLCGGTLITTWLVATAAHCLDMKKSKISVVQVDNDAGRNGVKRFVWDMKRHRKYVPNTEAYDIALVSVDVPFEIERRDIPLLLPIEFSETWGKPGDCAKVMGWGRTQNDFFGSSDLLSIKVPIWNNQRCVEAFANTGYASDLTDANICAGYVNGMYDSCQGDSGGPLLIKGGPGNFLVGVVSWGIGCGEVGRPGIYTRIAHPEIRDWIVESLDKLRPPTVQ